MPTPSVYNRIAAERDGLLEIIEGLLANWPHSEIADWYMPRKPKPVLTKTEALKRAVEALVASEQ